MARPSRAPKTVRVAAAEPARSRRPFPQRFWGKVLLLLATALLFNLALAPFSQFYLAWVALAPWLIVVANCRSARTAFFWSWLGGATFFTANMWWLVFVTGPGMAALVAVLGLYWAIAGAIIRGARLLEARSPLRMLTSVFLVAAVWVAFEWFHGTWPLGGLAWGFIGQSQSPVLALCQVADITGVFGISFWVALLNTWVAIFILRTLFPALPSGDAWGEGLGRGAPPAPSPQPSPAGGGRKTGSPGNLQFFVSASGAILLLTIAILAYGFLRLSQQPWTPGPRVLLVQPNFPQSNSGEKGATQEELIDFHLRMTRQALRRDPKIDLVVWSETMMPPLNPPAREFARVNHFDPHKFPWEEANQQILTLAREFNVNMLVGGTYHENWGTKYDQRLKDEVWVSADRRNSAYFCTPAGQADLRYDKIHLVPFGETLPFKSSLPPLYSLFLSLSPYSEEYTLTAGPSDAITVFKMRRDWRFVTPICFEDLDAPLLTRMLAPLDGRKRADFIVNITNDGWFKANEMPQHLQAAIFRSIEDRVPTARSVNTGVSGFVDSCGRLSGLIPVGQEGVSVATLTLDNRVSFYTRFGDVFAYVCATVSGFLLVVTLVRWLATRSRIKNARCDSHFFFRLGYELARVESMKTPIAISFLLVACTLAGCEPAGKPDPRTGRILPPSKPPPAYPASKDLPLDPQLRAAADQELVKSLRDSDPNVRAHAIEAVQETTGKEHAQQIVAALSDPDPLVRYAACLAVGQLKLVDAHEQLLKLADDDKDAGVRVVARFALHRIGDYRYSHDFERLSRDPEARVRGTTAMCLGMLEDPSALNVLRPMRHDVHPAVRQQTAVSMWRLGSEQGMKDLIGWTLSPYQDDQKIALLGLAAPHNRQVIQHIRVALVDPVAEVDLVAARAMGMLGCDEGYGVAQLGIKNPDPRQRVLAALAFGAIGRSDAQDLLRGALSDSNSDVRIAAAEAILQLKPHFVDECSLSK
jgi:apolipoprotein N-acyltransferase